jgi:polyribonucleotide nucleotidyltransferase
LDILIKAISLAQKELNFICSKMEEFLKQFNKEPIQITQNLVSDNLLEKASSIAQKYENKFFFTNKKEFQKVYEEFSTELANWYENLPEDEKTKFIPENKDPKTQLNLASFKAVKKLIRKHLLATGERLDGRNPLQVRPLYTQVGLLDKVHGSGLFQR